MKNLLIVCLAGAALLYAFQTPPSDFLTTKCGSGTAGTNYLIWTGQSSYPLCLAIGTTLKVTTVNGHATLDAVGGGAAALSQFNVPPSTDGTYLVPTAAGVVFRNGLLQSAGVDFKRAGLVLTPVGAWAADDVVTVVF